MSNAAALSAPSRAWRSQAVEGSSRSGVAVARTMASRSAAVIPARLQRLSLASQLSMATDWSGARDVALPDAGALDDPLVRGIQRPGEIGVGEDAGGNGDADARHLGDGAAASCRGRGFALGELGADVLAQIGLHRLHRHPDGVLDGVGGRSAVADDRHALHARAAARRRTRSSRACGTAPCISGRLSMSGTRCLTRPTNRRPTDS